MSDVWSRSQLDPPPHLKYLGIKRTQKTRWAARVPMVKLESLSGGSGVHVFLVLWKAARAVGTYAEKSITDLEMCGSDFAVLEALLHKGPLPVRSEEHTSELQSHLNLVCRLLLEKKKKHRNT